MGDCCGGDEGWKWLAEIAAGSGLRSVWIQMRLSWHAAVLNTNASDEQKRCPHLSPAQALILAHSFSWGLAARTLCAQGMMQLEPHHQFSMAGKRFTITVFWF